MKIFYIERNDRYDYDEYDSAVVIAETADKAVELLKQEHGYNSGSLHQEWGHYDVSVTELVPDGEPRIIIESFNAG